MKHETPARAATTPAKTTRVADRGATQRGTAHANAELVSQFMPQQAALRPRPKPHRRHKPAQKPTPVATSVSSATPPTTTVTPSPVYSSPVQTTPSPAPTHSTTRSTHKKSSGGSGTTTIGG